MDGIAFLYLGGFVPGEGNKQVELGISQDYLEGGRKGSIYHSNLRGGEVLCLIQRDIWPRLSISPDMEDEKNIEMHYFLS